MAETYDVNSMSEVPNVVNGILAGMEQQFQSVDYTPQMQSFLDTLQIAHGEYFDKDVGPSGAGWPPLAKSTIQRKGHDTILEDTGAMRASVEGETGDSIRSATHRGLVFGTEVEHAIFHQTGTKRMPKREFIGMDEMLLDQLVDKVAEATVKAIGGSGGSAGAAGAVAVR